MTKTKAILNWSGGKDSSLAFHKILQQGEYEIACLLTTISKEFQRISHHGVRVELLDRQAESIGLPLKKLELTTSPSMETYNNLMHTTMQDFSKENIRHAIFGDIFLEDLRQYREGKLAEVNFKGIFPLWKLETSSLAKEFIEIGFKEIIVCVDERYLDKSFVGREFDESFLQDLPDNVDPCGENGEFHTFVFDGPIFNSPVNFNLGEHTYRKYEAHPNSPDPIETGFWYGDLVDV